MTQRTIRKVRITAAVGVLVLAICLWLNPDMLRSEEPCEFDDGSDEWSCTESAHEYMGNCEGFDCYTSMEMCCLPEIIVE